MNSLTIADIQILLNRAGSDFEFIGDQNVFINGVTTIATLSDGKVAFFRGMDLSGYYKFLTPLNLCIVNNRVNRADLPVGNYILTNQPEVIFYRVASCFQVQKTREIHSTAFVSEKAVLGRNVSIGAFTYVGPNVIIQDDVSVDETCVLNNTSIGKGAVIQPGVKIGSEALGALKDETGAWFDRPHFGSVIIGENVRIEDNTIIQRGYLNDTTISDNVRIGPACKIGNGVAIGTGSLVGQSVTIAGSVVLGSNVSVWGNSAVREGVVIGDYSVVGMGAVVLVNIPASEVWVGNPARFLRVVQPT